MEMTGVLRSLADPWQLFCKHAHKRISNIQKHSYKSLKEYTIKFWMTLIRMFYFLKNKAWQHPNVFMHLHHNLLCGNRTKVKARSQGEVLPCHSLQVFKVNIEPRLWSPVSFFISWASDLFLSWLVCGGVGFKEGLMLRDTGHLEDFQRKSTEKLHSQRRLLNTALTPTVERKEPQFKHVI